MLWYESARAVHGRPHQFKGEYFDNLFIHYRPTGAWYTDQYQVTGYTQVGRDSSSLFRLEGSHGSSHYPYRRSGQLRDCKVKES